MYIYSHANIGQKTVSRGYKVVRLSGEREFDI